MLFVDWMSLVKVKVILNLMAKTIRVGWTVSFIIVDVSATTFLLLTLMYGSYTYLQFKLFHNIAFAGPLFAAVHAHISPDTFAGTVIDAALFAWILISFYVNTKQVPAPLEIMMASTMPTSVWVVLFLISLLLLKLLVPLEYLRRFTLWWFKDIDAHPLRAIAKVAATLIVIGAFALKAVRWGWMMF
jgi:hypothetical protein